MQLDFLEQDVPLLYELLVDRDASKGTQVCMCMYVHERVHAYNPIHTIHLLGGLHSVHIISLSISLSLSLAI